MPYNPNKQTNNDSDKFQILIFTEERWNCFRGFHGNVIKNASHYETWKSEVQNNRYCAFGRNLNHKKRFENRSGVK